MFYETDDIWGNFEDNIGKIDYSYYMSHMGSIYDQRDEFGATVCAEDMDFDHILCNYQELVNDLSKWVKSIKMPPQKYSLSSNDLFLTFNYTTVLEKVYKIKKSNILHIHGSIVNNKLCIGYDNVDKNRMLEDADCGIYTWEFPYEDLGYQILTNYMNCFHKNTRDIIKKNMMFLDKFSKCDELYILGSSFSETDKQYLEHIFSLINKSIKINISYYSRSDRMRISWFLRKNKIKDANVSTIDRILQYNC